jgi:hypothetical protein
VGCRKNGGCRRCGRHYDGLMLMAVRTVMLQMRSLRECRMQTKSKTGMRGRKVE